MIQQEREKLYQYTVRYSERFARYREETDKKGYKRMIGGKIKDKNEQDLKNNNTIIETPQKVSP